VPFETALMQWEEGDRRLRATPPYQRPALDRVVGRIVDELRRRLGGPFTADELVALYDRQGTGWCTDLAVAAAPDHPEAWDAQTVGDAAFHRYLRESADFAGGRLHVATSDDGSPGYGEY
jgi:hypothetical protein